MSQTEWVSMSNPPPVTDWYMVYAGNYGAMGWNADTKRWEDWTYAQAHNINPDEITHWREWPEPPINRMF